MLKHLKIAVKLALATLVLTGIIYPFAITGIALAAFPGQANGSLVRNGAGEVVGSSLIAQKFEDPEYFHEAVRLGVDGYLLKQETDTELFSAIHAIRSGGRFLSPFLERKLAQDLMALCRTREPSGFEALTRREKQILKFVVEGASSRKIAEHLHISPRTVERHRENIMRKLRVPDVVALVKLALQKGLV